MALVVAARLCCEKGSTVTVSSTVFVAGNDATEHLPRVPKVFQAGLRLAIIWSVPLRNFLGNVHSCRPLIVLPFPPGNSYAEDKPHWDQYEPHKKLWISYMRSGTTCVDLYARASSIGWLN